LFRTGISSTIEALIESLPVLGLEITGASIGAGIGALIGAGLGSLVFGAGAAPGAVAGAKIGAFVSGLMVGLNEEWILSQNIGGVSIGEWFEGFEKAAENLSDKLTEPIAQMIEGTSPLTFVTEGVPGAITAIANLSGEWILSQNIGGVSIDEWFKGVEEISDFADTLTEPIAQTIDNTINNVTEGLGSLWQTFSDIF